MGTEEPSAQEQSAAQRPVLRIVRGEPTDQEIAALVTVVAALAARGGAPDDPLRSQWRNRARNIRPAIGPGPGAWRASGLPR
ncbi:MAG: acyl-CoA carboxylase subunit epsilon [Actinomycetes bacterium]